MKGYRHYRITEVHIVERKFQRLFGVSFQPFFDPALSVIFRHVNLDLLKFNKWLRDQLGAQSDAPITEIVRKKYGAEAEKLLICLTI